MMYIWAVARFGECKTLWKISTSRWSFRCATHSGFANEMCHFSEWTYRPANVCVYVWTRVCTHACVHVCVRACVHVCVCVSCGVYLVCVME